MPQDAEIVDYMKGVLNNAGRKLKASYDSGPGGENAVLDPQEAGILYRILTEQFGIKFEV